MNQGNDTSAIQWSQWQKDSLSIGVPISDEQRALFERFYDLLTEANRSVNLTRITALEDFLYRHLLDSLTLSSFITPQASLADIGSGAGFPAIPLALVRSDLQITAVESTGKKCKFIQSVQSNLALNHLTVLNERSETLASQPAYREKFDFVTARAVAALPALLEFCLPLLKPGGQFLAMKGLNYETELQTSQVALKLLGGKFCEVKTFTHPRLVGSRLLVFEKIARTPVLYPRPAGLPSKKPL